MKTSFSHWMTMSLLFLVVFHNNHSNNKNSYCAKAFTPDAAFKMKNAMMGGGTTSNTVGGAMMSGISSSSTSGSTSSPPVAFVNKIGNERNMQLSLLLSHENSRKSITTPPSFEDYMEVRRRSLLRMLDTLKKIE